MEKDFKKLLIISNNPMSKVRNNGKTVASFVEGIPCDRVRQLYFSSEKPSVPGYSYYSISDFDVINGLFSRPKRGRACIAPVQSTSSCPQYSDNICVKRNTFTRILREFAWKGHWKSKQLLDWLDDFEPDVVFFVAGDCGFSYDITWFVVERYNSRLVSYYTDDYIVKRSNETFLSTQRRKYIRKKVLTCIEKSSAYFTISSLMREEYRKISGKDSALIMNITPSLKEDCNFEEKPDEIELVYAGSLYYNRDRVIGSIAEAVKIINQSGILSEKRIKMRVFSTNKPDDKSLALFVRENCCEYCGSLNPDQLKITLNAADILVFVESFDIEMQEKTRYSLSTKISEYMSLEKPILAVGPSGIGSMEYLSDVAFCCNDISLVYNTLIDMLKSEDRMKAKAMLAYNKYLKNHNAEQQRDMFQTVCGIK